MRDKTETQARLERARIINHIDRQFSLQQRHSLCRYWVTKKVPGGEDLLMLRVEEVVKKELTNRDARNK